jgi:hypothetical protein
MHCLVIVKLHEISVGKCEQLRLFLPHFYTFSDCGPVKKILRGRVILDKTKTSTYGATATVKCSPGYRPNQKKIVCLDTGEWETARCKIKGNVQYLLDPNELPTLITSQYMILKIYN